MISAQEAFRNLGKPNFMTPRIIQRWTQGAYHFELSSGEGVFNRSDTLYGLTVLNLDGSRPDYSLKLSGCFRSSGEALARAREIARGWGMICGECHHVDLIHDAERGGECFQVKNGERCDCRGFMEEEPDYYPERGAD